MMKTAPEHYDLLYGDLSVYPQDVVKWIFVSGWNSAISEVVAQLEQLPLDEETQSFLLLYIKSMCVVDPKEKEKMQ